MAQKKFTIAVSGWTRPLLDEVDKLGEKVNRTRSGFIVQTMREMVEKAKAEKLADKEGAK